MSNHHALGTPALVRVLLALVLVFPFLSADHQAAAQGYDRIARARTKKMLEEVAGEIRKRYFDEKFRGLDLEAHFAKTDQKLEGATSLNHAFGIIAQSLLDFDDSHTFFVPPGLSVSADYGWRMKMVGDTCCVTAVRPGSDAEARGLRAGDRLLTLEGYQPTRRDLWQLQYIFYTLNPMRAMAVEAQSPGVQPRRLEIASKVTQRRRVVDLTEDDGFDVEALIREADDGLAGHAFLKSDKTIIWKMPSFDLTREEIDGFVRNNLKADSSLILDLRGNGGGYVTALEDLTARFFDRKVKIADRKGRKAMKPIVARKRGGSPLSGRLVVLIDSGSASAAEPFARVVQPERRGTVIGDRSAGAVMQAETFSGELGTDRVVLYGASLTTADLIMTDGKSLEGSGVVPDELVLPSAEDLAAGRDPALARAAALVGLDLSPEDAGATFPIRWRK